MIAIFLILLICGPTTAVADTKVKPREPWNCYWSKQKISLHYDVEGASDMADRVDWLVSIRDQVVSQRSVTIPTKGDRPANLAISIELPEVEAGNVTAVSVLLRSGDQRVHRRDLYVFPQEAFADQQKALEAMQITLFDPTKRTSAVFEKSRVPHSTTRNVEVLSSLQRGTLVIGEGVSFREYRSLPEIMVRAAARGVNVVCLAPSDGGISLPGVEPSSLPQPTRFMLRRNDVIRQFDKRLDSTAWPEDGNIIASSIRVTNDRQGLSGVMQEGGGGWPWMEVNYAESGGMLFVCGFAIIEKWDTTPTPRYFLNQLFRHIGNVQQIEQDVVPPNESKGPNP